MFLGRLPSDSTATGEGEAPAEPRNRRQTVARQEPRPPGRMLPCRPVVIPAEAGIQHDVGPRQRHAGMTGEGTCGDDERGDMRE